MPRLFVSIDLPERIKARLSTLRTGALAARWVEPEKLHLTLRFVGDVDEGVAQEIDAALRRVDAPRFSLTLKGIGHFRRHTLWVGIENCPPLMSLQAKVEDAIRRAGLLGEAGRYVPHVKLARLRWRGGSQLRSLPNDCVLFCAEPFEVEQFSLIESRLSRTGATYEHRADYALRPIRQSVGEAAAGPQRSL